MSRLAFLLLLVAAFLLFLLSKDLLSSRPSAPTGSTHPPRSVLTPPPTGAMRINDVDLLRPSTSSIGHPPDRMGEAGSKPAGRSVISTAYCERGAMANGQQVHDGAAARNGVRFGSRFRILSGPLAGKVVTITDRHAAGSTGLDVWMASCDEARGYGRRHISIEEVPS